MKDLPYWRIQAIQVAALGPYASVGRCFFCGGDEPLASFQPGPFSYRVACCRRCREARTGVPDTRGLIQGTATISSPPELTTPGAVRGLIPATTSETRPPSILDAVREARETVAPPEILMHPKDAEAFGIDPETILEARAILNRQPVKLSDRDVDAILAPWGSNPGEDSELVGDRNAIDAEMLALSNLDQQLDAIIADLDRRRDEAFLGIVTEDARTESTTPPLTLEALRAIQRELEANRPELSRIIVDFPGTPFSEALKWESRSILLMGRGVLDALARAASTPLSRVDQNAEWTIAGVKVERWGTRPDHEELLRAFVAELMAGPKK